MLNQPIKELKLISPAKLNLALQITGRRPDGFHTLNTIFERISLTDTITFSALRGSEIQIVCDHPAVPVDQRNLVYKAAMLLREKTGVYKGVRINIKKNIPVAAGLAGGSSNAATALLGLNQLWDLKLSRLALIHLARRTGSDVAFFLYDTPLAFGTDRGDKIKKIACKNSLWHVLITAEQPLLTKDVYGIYAKQFLAVNKPGLTKKTADVRMLIRFLKLGDIEGVQKHVFNDLEEPIGVLSPSLLELKAQLKELMPEGVCFSGSGPSIFAVMETKSEAERVARIFRLKYKQVFVVHTV